MPAPQDQRQDPKARLAAQLRAGCRALLSHAGLSLDLARKLDPRTPSPFPAEVEAMLQDTLKQAQQEAAAEQAAAQRQVNDANARASDAERRLAEAQASLGKAQSAIDSQRALINRQQGTIAAIANATRKHLEEATASAPAAPPDAAGA